MAVKFIKCIFLISFALMFTAEPTLAKDIKVPESEAEKLMFDVDIEIPEIKEVDEKESEEENEKEIPPAPLTSVTSGPVPTITETMPEQQKTKAAAVTSISKKPVSNPSLPLVKNERKGLSDEINKIEVLANPIFNPKSLKSPYLDYFLNYFLLNFLTVFVVPVIILTVYRYKKISKLL